MVHHTSGEPVLWGWVRWDSQELHILCLFVLQPWGSVCASRAGQKLLGVSSCCFTRKSTQALTFCGYYLVNWKSELWNLTEGVISLGGIQRKAPATEGSLDGRNLQHEAWCPAWEGPGTRTVSLSWQSTETPTHGIPPTWPLSAVPALQWKCPFWASQRMILA